MRARFARRPNRQSPLATARVLATAPDLHNVRFLSFSTVFAAVLAVFLSRAVTSRMRALVLFFGHGRTSFLSEPGGVRVMLFWIMLSRASDEVKLRLSQVCPLKYPLRALRESLSFSPGFPV